MHVRGVLTTSLPSACVLPVRHGRSRGVCGVLRGFCAEFLPRSGQNADVQNERGSLAFSEVLGVPLKSSTSINESPRRRLRSHHVLVNFLARSTNSMPERDSVTGPIGHEHGIFRFTFSTDSVCLPPN